MQVLDGRIQEVFAEFGKSREALLPSLKIAQKRFGCIPREMIGYLSDQLHISPLEIYGAISFYGMLSTALQGKYIVRVCSSLPCHVNGASPLRNVVEEELGIQPGETTADKLFSFEVVGCLGLCDCAPAMLVNDKVYGPLTPSEARAILFDLKASEAA